MKNNYFFIFNIVFLISCPSMIYCSKQQAVTQNNDNESIRLAEFNLTYNTNQTISGSFPVKKMPDRRAIGFDENTALSIFPDGKSVLQYYKPRGFNFLLSYDTNGVYSAAVITPVGTINNIPNAPCVFPTITKITKSGVVLFEWPVNNVGTTEKK